MALYPKQLQYLQEDTGFRKAPGETVVYANGYTPGAPLTVNDVIQDISEAVYGADVYGATHNVRTRDRFRKITGSFGDVVVFPASPIAGPQAANELIGVLRVLWGIANPRTVNKTGKATSVQN